jgi:hypothetical protein
MAVDGSVTPQLFVYSPEVGYQVKLAHLLFTLEDDAAFRAERFAGLSSALTNGLQLFVDSGGGSARVLELTDGVPIKSNAGFARLMHEVRYDSYGSGNSFISAHMQFNTITDEGLVLYEDDRLVVEIDDDLSSVVEFYATVQGQRRRRT